jgi:hypothetical protein
VLRSQDELAWVASSIHLPIHPVMHAEKLSAKKVDSFANRAANIYEVKFNGVSPSGKAAGFGPAIPRFES